MARLRSLLYAIFLIVTVIPYAFACVLWAPLPLHLRYKLTVGWPRLAIWGARDLRHPLAGEGLGKPARRPGRDPVKHQSAGNAVLSRLHAARSLLRLQEGTAHGAVLRLGLALLRMIAIDRSKGRDAFEQVVAQGRKRMDEGRWPRLSGRHARAPGQAGRFKMGGALLASRTGAKVIPVAHNAGECWRRNAFVKRRDWLRCPSDPR